MQKMNERQVSGRGNVALIVALWVFVSGEPLNSRRALTQAEFALSKISQFFGIIRQIMVFRLIVRRSCPGLCGHIAGVRLVAGNACRVHGLFLCRSTGTHDHAEQGKESYCCFSAAVSRTGLR